MNTSRSFDRAADSYDQTRPLFDASADAGADLFQVAGIGLAGTEAWVPAESEMGN